jgi:hypothetical protein
MNAHGLTRDQLLDLLDRWRDDGDAAARDRILAEFARLDGAIQILTDVLIAVATEGGTDAHEADV